MPAVVMYSTDGCGFCARARRLLERRGVDFREIRVDLQPERRAEMVERSGGRDSVPQLFVGERHLGGYEELVELDLDGELDAALHG